MGKVLEIKLVKSTIGYPKRQGRTVRALGLHKLGDTVVKRDHPSVRGMLRVVRHLTEVKERPETEAEAEARRNQSRGRTGVAPAAAPTVPKESDKAGKARSPEKVAKVQSPEKAGKVRSPEKADAGTKVKTAGKTKPAVNTAGKTKPAPKPAAEPAVKTAAKPRKAAPESKAADGSASGTPAASAEPHRPSAPAGREPEGEPGDAGTQ